MSAAAEMLALAATAGAVQKQPQPAMAAALIRGVACAQKTSCTAAAGSPAAVAGDATARVVVPSGSAQCPASGAGAACGTPNPVAERGTPTLPGSMGPCPLDVGKPDLGVPGACATSETSGVQAS